MALDQFEYPLNRDFIWICSEAVELLQALDDYEKKALLFFNHSGHAFGEYTEETACFDWEVGKFGPLGPFIPKPYKGPIQFMREDLCFMCFRKLSSFLGAVYFVQDHINSKFKRSGVPVRADEFELDKYVEAKEKLDLDTFQKARALRNKLHQETSTLYCEVIGPLEKPLIKVDAIRIKDKEMNEILEMDVRKLVESIRTETFSLSNLLYPLKDDKYYRTFGWDNPDEWHWNYREGSL